VFKLKEDIKSHLSKKKISFKDIGPFNDDRVDYPDYAHKVARKVKTNKNNVGILVCGSGMGMNIAANRHKNIRAAQCFNLKSTKLSRLHNDANIITLGSRLLNKKLALNCVNTFLNTKFEGGRHIKRIKKI
jgi:ribose 5-phosphate isomerase B